MHTRDERKILLSIAVSFVLHLHDLHHVEVDGLVGFPDGQNSVHHSLRKTSIVSVLQENPMRPSRGTINHPINCNHTEGVRKCIFRSLYCSWRLAYEVK